MAVKTAHIKNFSTRQHICEKIQCKSVSTNLAENANAIGSFWELLKCVCLGSSGGCASLPMLCTISITNGRYRNKQKEIFYFTIYQIHWRDCLVCFILAIGKAFKKSVFLGLFRNSGQHPPIHPKDLEFEPHPPTVWEKVLKN